MNMTWTKAALIRAIKTMAQTAVALIGTGAVGVMDVDWLNVVSVTVVAGILSVLTSIGGLPEVTAQKLAEKEDVEHGYFEEDDDDDETDSE